MSSKVAIEVRRHGRPGVWRYSDLDSRQRQIAEQVRSDASARGALLLSEVSPVITFGRRAGKGELLAPEALLNQQGIELYGADRGGLATYHGPGQWVLFVVDRLEALTGDRRGVRKAVEGLLEIAREVGCEYDTSAEIREGCEMGVWGKQGKFAAVGVHIEKGVLLHGLAINAFRTPTSFVGLRPYGLDAPVSFLLENTLGARASEDSALRDREFEKLGERIVTSALKRFWH